MSDANKYNQMFDYLSAPSLPTEPEAAVVFGRNDPLVAYKLGDLIIPGLVETVVISGGVGKDTGDLLERGYTSESDFLNQTLQADAKRRNFNVPPTYFDVKALNGGDNARFSLAILDEKSVDTSSLTAVAHATSARRLAETLKFEANKRGKGETTVHTAPTDYNFDPSNPVDREEAAAELLRIAEWPAKGFLGPQEDVPENLVDFAKDMHGAAPRPMTDLQRAILSRMPKGAKHAIIKLAAKHGHK